ncbi:hypothetical protein RND81_14G081100 [Saponaria officinalis]|uniref:Uncharacterized protein n=1 Tax=Saponaria officinalis TaxID=3572 RepID=A0AAW1GPR3_SAPOF
MEFECNMQREGSIITQIDENSSVQLEFLTIEAENGSNIEVTHPQNPKSKGFCESEVWDKMNFSNREELINRRLTPWRRTMLRKFYHLLLKCEDSLQARAILEDGLKRDMEEIEKLMTYVDVNEEQENINEGTHQQKILNRKCIKTKGRSARKKGHFEKRKMNTSNEFINYQYTIPERLL